MNNTKLFAVSLLAILIISSVPIYLYLTNTEEAEQQIAVNKFSSYDDLKTFLETSSSAANEYWLRSSVKGDAVAESGEYSAQTTNADATISVPMEPSASEETEYSETNIQVAGVDEADIVKTDGEYIYIVSGNNITIVKAYPAEQAKIVSKISLDGTITGILINGDKLAVFETEYTPYLLYETVVSKTEVAVAPVDDVGDAPENATSDSDDTENMTRTDEEPVTEPANASTHIEEPNDIIIEPIIWEPPTTYIKVYDTSDKENPVLTRDFAVDGDYFDSRMIGDYVYVIATMYSYYTDTDVALPRIQSNNQTETIQATDIYYYNFSDTSYTFTTIVALNINDDTQEATHETVLLGGTSGIYVSTNNLYLTFPDYNWEEDDTTTTTIYRASINEDSVTFVASGEVPGQVLNQFSMDEHDGYFRVATTIYNYNWNWRTFAEDSTEEESTHQNNVYVLDMDLNVVGELENLAPGEQIYSARFMGDRLYLVTFRNIDPLFVIDLSDPTEPTVLGELKVTGYSGYLHIYDEDHVIGIGKETDYDAEQDFAWYQGIKISLFDVSDVSNPVEVAKYEIGDRGTDSPILYDHKALLFDKEKNILVIPVTVAEIDESDYDGEIPDWAYGEYVWQGAYVLDISLDGIELRGQITHMEDGMMTDNGFYYYYSYSGYIVQRSLYIEDVLYTISDMMLKMNNLDTLEEINTIELA
ncbi:MAG: beta-propeller domain-containing protein [Candidatus Bathyarchaeota archaeon]|nr:beta-propeller domain-containing protein [Candidatus Bathyarchaeum sp.]